jgi:PhnB protein
MSEGRAIMSAMTIAMTPYLSFRDNAREAMEFYRSVFDGELTIDTFGSFDVGIEEVESELVMHAQLDTPDGLTLMASDTPTGMPYSVPAGFSVSLSGDDDARLEGYWHALGAGGTVTMPLDTPPWGGRFGMLTDRFGIAWMVAITPAVA